MRRDDLSHGCPVANRRFISPCRDRRKDSLCVRPIVGTDDLRRRLLGPTRRIDHKRQIRRVAGGARCRRTEVRAHAPVVQKPRFAIDAAIAIDRASQRKHRVRGRKITRGATTTRGFAACARGDYHTQNDDETERHGAWGAGESVQSRRHSPNVSRREASERAITCMPMEELSRLEDA